jgi:centrosomal CEP192-like protein/HYDIN/CFA65/VesB family protein
VKAPGAHKWSVLGLGPVDEPLCGQMSFSDLPACGRSRETTTAMASPRFLRPLVLTLSFFPLFPGHAVAGSTQKLAAAPASLSFGSVRLGNSQGLYAALTNASSSSVTINQATVSGAAFSLRGLSLPVTLAPKQSYTFSVVFAPTVAGTASGSISVGFSPPASNLGIALSGTGTTAGQLAASPTSLSFGSVVVGTSKTLKATLSVSGASTTITSATSTSSEFVLSGLSFPLTLAPGQSVSFSMRFSPQASGTASASVSFGSNASNSPVSASLTGTGAASPQHSVSLSWSASTSGVVGYNVYRGSVTGGPYTKINSVLSASTNYADNSVQAGQTYFYVTTAVNGSGLESGYSNQVKAAIPTP